jgi:translocation and assembly module TamB
VVYASGDTRVSIDKIDSRWSATWSPARLHVEWLRLGKIDVRLPPSAPTPDTGPAQMPKSLELPLALDVDTLTIAELSLLQGPPATATPQVFSDLAGALHSDGMRHRVVVDKLVTPYGKLQANAQIAGQAPFALWTPCAPRRKPPATASARGPAST